MILFLILIDSDTYTDIDTHNDIDIDYIILHYDILYNMILHHIILILYYIISYHNVLYLYYTILYYIHIKPFYIL